MDERRLQDRRPLFAKSFSESFSRLEGHASSNAKLAGNPLLETRLFELCSDGLAAVRARSNFPRAGQSLFAKGEQMADDSADKFVDWYMKLEVGTSEWGTTTVSLNKYMIGADTTSEKAQARNAVLAAARRKQLSPRQGPFTRANNGKVSPADCEHILSMAVDSGAVKRENIQAWADKNFGVDCTGFAVAYYDWINLIDIEHYSGGASCFALLNKAKNNHRPADGGPLIWDLGDVQADDMILWMNEAQVETRAPGHIALIYDIDSDAGILYTAESNGANDGHGHYGPKITQRNWVGPHSGGGPRYIQLGKSDKVIIVRPPPKFG